MDISCPLTYLQQVLTVTVPLFLHCTDSRKAPCRNQGYGPRSSQLSEVDYILKISTLHLLVANSDSSKSSSGKVVLIHSFCLVWFSRFQTILKQILFATRGFQTLFLQPLWAGLVWGRCSCGPVRSSTTSTPTTVPTTTATSPSPSRRQSGSMPLPSLDVSSASPWQVR